MKQKNSLMAKYLTEEIFEQLKDKKTVKGYTLQNLIASGKENPDSSIGTYAGDKESYELFAPLLDPIIEEYHSFSKNDIHKSDFDPQKLQFSNPDEEGKYIISTRVRVARNLKNIALGTAISKKDRDEVEKKISTLLLEFDGTLAGNYYSLNNLDEVEKNNLIKDHFLFKAGDRFLESAGLNRDWPEGRGIFHNNEKTFLVWINEEDQLRVISMQKGGDIKAVFTRLSDAISKLEQKISFSYSEHLGYITSCPTNLGTAMRASVHIKLPNLSKNMQEFQMITDRYNVQIRGIDGEHSQSTEAIYDISNKRRLGVTEVECIQDMYNGVVALIKREKELE